MQLPLTLTRIPVLAALLGPALLFGQTRLTPTHDDIPYATAHENQKVDVYLAENSEPTPIMVYIHGGGWRGGSRDRIPAFLAAAVQEGWLSVVSVGYRFTDVATHPAQTEDCVRAIQFVRSRAKEWKIDPQRLGVSGGSAGAHLALWIALHDDLADPDSTDPVARQSSRVACAIGFAGPTDWELLGKLPHAHPGYRNLLGYEAGTPLDKMDPARVASVSPITMVSQDDPPVLIVHGDLDDVVPQEHALSLHEKLGAAGVDSDLLVIEGGKHNVAGAGHPTVTKRSTAFIREHLLRNDGN